MDFTETPLEGAYLVCERRISDHRGFFARAWCRQEFSARGLSSNMVQLNVGFSPVAGTLRGLHYQEVPHAEAKLVRCTRGGIFDVIVDLRPDSPTRNQWFGVELTASNGLMLYAPEGFAHGYQTLAPETEMYYMTSAPYEASAARGVRHDDPALGILWPLSVAAISEADRSWPDLRRATPAV
jgi:dTDP-4-dehydrorhamnose 3,5-epimerase